MIPQRAQDLTVLQETFPGGRVQSFLRPSDRRAIATLYIVPLALRAWPFGVACPPIVFGR